MVRLTDRPDMTIDVYCGRKTTIQLQQLQPDIFAKVMSCRVKQVDLNWEFFRSESILQL